MQSGKGGVNEGKENATIVVRRQKLINWWWHRRGEFNEWMRVRVVFCINISNLLHGSIVFWGGVYLHTIRLRGPHLILFNESNPNQTEPSQCFWFLLKVVCGSISLTGSKHISLLFCWVWGERKREIIMGSLVSTPAHYCVAHNIT